ncbi:MAG TPA: hypothetical protein VGG62_11825, partial [Terracidiphilus sp.]
SVGTKLLMGRGISAQDTANSAKVAVVNETFVKKLFATGENPIGHRFGKSQCAHRFGLLPRNRPVCSDFQREPSTVATESK